MAREVRKASLSSKFRSRFFFFVSIFGQLKRYKKPPPHRQQYQLFEYKYLSQSTIVASYCCCYSTLLDSVVLRVSTIMAPHVKPVPLSDEQSPLILVADGDHGAIPRLSNDRVHDVTYTKTLDETVVTHGTYLYVGTVLVF